MKYWELFFLTLGAGLLVDAVIKPKSWFAIPIGFLCEIAGDALFYLQERSR